MVIEARIPLFDLIASVSDTVDLICPLMNNHQMQVAYIAYTLGKEMGWDEQACADLLVAGAFHDMGAFSSQERTDLLEFEVLRPHLHAKVGARLLSEFGPFAAVAKLVQFHHVPWGDGKGLVFEDEPVPMGSHVLHLSDRVAVIIDAKEPILGQARRIREKTLSQTPRLFAPEVFEAFRVVSDKDAFWMDVTQRNLAELLRRRVELGTLELDMAGLCGLANLFRRMIDFRSRFTATHSSGVAVSARALAELAGFSEHNCQLMEIAGYFHDIGKLGIPTEILQKPARLNDYEYDIMRSHVYNTFRILEPVMELDTVRMWSSQHQEYLDGTGYPFRLTDKELPMGSRIMAVADVFTALTENRPYRNALSDDEAKAILDKLGQDMKMDIGLIALLREHFVEVNEKRAAAQLASEKEYQQFLASL